MTHVYTPPEPTTEVRGAPTSREQEDGHGHSLERHGIRDPALGKPCVAYVFYSACNITLRRKGWNAGM